MLSWVERIGARSVDARLPAAIRVVAGCAALWKLPRLVQAIPPERVALGQPWAAAAAAAWVVCALGVVFGIAARPAAFLLAGGLVASQELAERWGANVHLLALILLLLSLTQCDRALALRPPARSRTVPGWTMLVLQWHFSIVYGFAAIAKLNEDFVSGMALHAFLSSFARAAVVPAGLQRSVVFLSGASILAVIAEAFVAIGVWNRALRPFALALILPLHMGMTVLLAHSPGHAGDLVMFGVLMLATAAPFVVEADSPHRTPRSSLRHPPS